jgi:hypothetical protein
MFLDEKKCDQLLSELEYMNDVRKPPDGNRRGQFKGGWREATERGRVYRENTLERLTWHNLGYRLGEKFGARDGDDIDETFECFAHHYESRGRSSSK